MAWGVLSRVALYSLPRDGLDDLTEESRPSLRLPIGSEMLRRKSLFLIRQEIPTPTCRPTAQGTSLFSPLP